MTATRKPVKLILPYQGFSVIELVVVTAILTILFSLLIPAVKKSRASAHRVECMNNIRNVNLAILQCTDNIGRFPACGKFGQTTTHGSWVLDILPYLDQTVLYNQWNWDGGVTDPANEILKQTSIRVLTCPDDISVKPKFGNLSYVVNGGVGFTARMNGIHDCPIDPDGRKLDLNGNGVVCPSDEGDLGDKQLFLAMGLFFNETWKWDVTIRHHTMATVTDGLSQTVVLSENVRAGYDPTDPNTNNWANSNPYRTSFYLGNPCQDATCHPGTVDYARCNRGNYAINSGLTKPEGTSPIPNSFHVGGVHMSYGDGSVKFMNQNLDGAVYAALLSPQGESLGSPLNQIIP
jgi:type II secretory pathway pseudopilin PulG